MNAPPSTTGPLGRPRGIGFGILLFIVTLGIYGVYWIYKSCEEIKQHANIGVGGLLGLVIWLVIGIVMCFELPSEIGKMYKADGQEAPFSGWIGLWVLLPIVGGIVWFVKVQGALNRYWEGKSEPAPAAAAVPAA
jgi:amino acid transporter